MINAVELSAETAFLRFLADLEIRTGRSIFYFSPLDVQVREVTGILLDKPRWKLDLCLPLVQLVLPTSLRRQFGAAAIGNCMGGRRTGSLADDQFGVNPQNPGQWLM
jgi:hypothetical protein